LQAHSQRTKPVVKSLNTPQCLGGLELQPQVPRFAPNVFGSSPIRAYRLGRDVQQLVNSNQEVQIIQRPIAALVKAVAPGLAAALPPRC
jgi:hypothetical protein